MFAQNIVRFLHFLERPCPQHNVSHHSASCSLMEQNCRADILKQLTVTVYVSQRTHMLVCVHTPIVAQASVDPCWYI